MQKTFLPHCVFLVCFLTPQICSAAARHAEMLVDERMLMPAYKLGKTYQSKDDSSVSCLEGHAGAVLNSKKCVGGLSSERESPVCSDVECDIQGALDRTTYYCSKVTKQCEELICSGANTTGYKQCYKKYFFETSKKEHPDMRKCAANENKDGGYYCKVTCSAALFASGESAKADAQRFMQRLKIDAAAWKKPSQALSYYRELPYDEDDPDANVFYSDAFAVGCYQGTFYPMALNGSSTYFLPFFSVATGGTAGDTDDSGAPGEYAWGGKPASMTLTRKGAASISSLYEIVKGSNYGSTETVYRAFNTWTQGKPNKVFWFFSYRNQNGAQVASSIRSHFAEAAKSKSKYETLNPELGARIGEPKIYYLGKSTLCALFDNGYRGKNNDTISGYNNIYMFYIPQQDVVSWRARVESFSTALVQWDFNTGDRITCCADARLRHKTTNVAGPLCFDLNSELGIQDID